MDSQRDMPRFLLYLQTLFLLSCSTPSATDPILPKKGASPNIFRHYQREDDSKMASGWVRGMDMSGVAFDKRQTATLVSRRHAVMADHFKRGVGQRVVFHDRNGKRLERKLIEVRKVKADVAVGLLDQPVLSNYKVYPLPRIADPERIVGRPVMVTDQNRRLFFHKVQRTSQWRIAFEYDKEDRHGWGKRLISGDSGNPSFLIMGKELVLVETHSTGNAGAGPFYGSPIIQEILRKVMAEMDPTHTFRLVTVN